jgi:hypothetical protein
MQVASSHSDWRRWMMPIVLGISLPLLFAALPGGPVQSLVRYGGQMKHVRTEIAALHTVRVGFQQDGLSGLSKSAISGVRQSLDGVTSKNVAVLRDAIDLYAQRYSEPLPVDTSSGAIELVLGQLQTADEARLREPLLAMHAAEAILRLERDPHAADQMSRWAGVFAARLDGIALPQGTRTNLLARLTAYQRDVLSAADKQGSGALAVETALTNAERALAADQQQATNAFEGACKRFLWSFGAALAASLLIVGGVAFGRTALDHGGARTRHAG